MIKLTKMDMIFILLIICFLNFCLWVFFGISFVYSLDQGGSEEVSTFGGLGINFFKNFPITAVISVIFGLIFIPILNWITKNYKG